MTLHRAENHNQQPVYSSIYEGSQNCWTNHPRNSIKISEK